MGFLCTHLSRESLPIVEDFFHRLASKGMHDLLWMLMSAIRGTQLDVSYWVLRILNENLAAGRQAVRQMAARSAASRQSAQDYHSLLSACLPRPGQPSKRACEAAAVAFPALILAFWSGQANRLERAPGPLGEFLDLPLKGPDASAATVHSYWTKSFLSSGFDEAVRVWSDDRETPPGLPLALALFQMVSLAAPVGTGVSLNIAAEVRRDDLARWRQLRFYWLMFVEILEGDLRSVPRGDAHHARRLQLDQIIHGTRQLIGL